MKFSRSILLFSSALLSASSAFALDVKSPYVEKGIMEIESKNRVDFDDRAGEDRFRQHKLGVGYGFTSWFMAELEGEWEKDAGHGYKYAATEIETKFQLTDVGEYWLDVGLFGAYVFAHPQGDADKVEGYLLLSKNFQKFTVMANLGIEQEVGDNANDNPEGEVKLMGKYNYTPMLNPGIEYYGALGEISDPNKYSQQKHRLGPVIYGNLGHGVKYELGTLFGISKASEDYAVKLNLEYEFPVKW